MTAQEFLAAIKDAKTLADGKAVASLFQGNFLKLSPTDQAGIRATWRRRKAELAAANAD